MASKTINYLSKDFDTYKKNLIEFAKTYYPNTYNDFSEASPGMMFIEMAAYVGDVLSLYTDYSMKETLLDRAQEQKNVFAIAQTFGYKPRVTTPATARLSIYQLVPSINTGADSRPDYRYALIVNEGAICSTVGNLTFTTLNQVDFAASSSANPTTVSVYQINQTTGAPEYYLLKKHVDCEHGDVKTQTFQFGSAKPNESVVINDTEESSTAWDICMIMKENGLIAKPTHGNIIRFAPPLVINKDEIIKCCDIIKGSIIEYEKSN